MQPAGILQDNNIKEKKENLSSEPVSKEKSIMAHLQQANPKQSRTMSSVIIVTKGDTFLLNVYQQPCFVE